MAESSKPPILDRLVVSPCSNPEMLLEEALRAYSDLGYTQFEVFTSWTKSAVNYHADPAPYLALADRFGMKYVSFHLPLITDDLEASLEEAVNATEFAVALGCEVVIYKATSIENYVACGKPYLERIKEMAITPVLQNHAHSALATLDDYVEVLDGISDRRMKALLEVGHFHSLGIAWQQGVALLEDTIALVHIRDQIREQSVPLGAGEIDLPGLFQHLRAVGYSGKYVVEMEVEDRENTLKYLGDAIEYVQAKCQGRAKG